MPTSSGTVNRLNEDNRSQESGGSFVTAINIGRRCIKKFKKFCSRKKQTNDDDCCGREICEGDSLPSDNSYKKLRHRWTDEIAQLGFRIKHHRRSSASASSISWTSYLEDSRRASAVTRPSMQTVATYLEEVYVFQNSHNETIQEQLMTDKSLHV